MNIYLNIHLNIHCHFKWRWIYRTLVIQAIHEYSYEYSSGYDPQMSIGNLHKKIAHKPFKRFVLNRFHYRYFHSEKSRMLYNQLLIQQSPKRCRRSSPPRPASILEDGAASPVALSDVERSGAWQGFFGIDASKHKFLLITAWNQSHRFLHPFIREILWEWFQDSILWRSHAWGKLRLLFIILGSARAPNRL